MSANKLESYTDLTKRCNHILEYEFVHYDEHILS